MELSSPASALDAGQRPLGMPDTATQQSRMHPLVRQDDRRSKTRAVCQDGPQIEQAVSSGAIERPAGAPSKRPDNDARHIAQHSNPSRPVMLRYERDRGGDISERNVALALGGDRIAGHSFDDCLWRKGANKRYEKPIDDEADRVHLSLTITCVSV